MTVRDRTARSALVGLVVVLGFATTAQAASASPRTGQIRGAGDVAAVADSYLVILKDRPVGKSTRTQLAVTGAAKTITDRAGGKVARTFQYAVRGFELSGSAAVASRIAADPAVAFVEQNHRLRISDTQFPVPSWGLDRVDQRQLPLDGRYSYPSLAANVRAYILDTGIRVSHREFGGRAISGFDAIDGGPADDCHGHGTHVAGTVGGDSYGVAKGVALVAVRVLNCDGEGTTAQVVAGIDWVTGDHDPGEPAVANMSLGGEVDDVLDAAVAGSIADGITYAVAAGNDDVSACQHSPARTPAAITVGATGGFLGEDDDRADFSNFGDCVDIFAPGVDILSASNGSDSDSETLSGTSMATPHVTGAAALVLTRTPSATPQQIRDQLVDDATAGVVGNRGAGSPDALLFVVNQPPANDFALAVTPAADSVNPGGSISATVRTTITAGTTQPVNLAVFGLPSGATATLTPSSVPSGGSATLQIATSATIPIGVYRITVTGTGAASGAGHRTSYQLSVNGPAGCVVTNPTRVPIGDLTTVESAVPIHGCAGNGSPRSSVQVHIAHTFPPDLRIDLLAPNGTQYPLFDGDFVETETLDLSATLDLSGQLADGAWRLIVTDQVSGDSGTLLSWKLDLAGLPVTPGCTGSNPGDTLLADLSTTVSAIPIAGCGRRASATSAVEVHIVHSFIGDLVIDLVAPDGTAYRLQDSSDDDTEDLDHTYPLNLSSESADGVWRLRISDVGVFDTGFINSWTLRL